MIEKIVYKFIDSLGNYNNYSVDEMERAKYFMKVMVYEIIKIILIVSIFSILGYFKECFIIILVMSFTKPFIGGYHEDTQLKCFISTSIIVSFIIFLVRTNNINFISCIILNFISIFSIYNKAPVINDKMPITREDLIKKNRNIGIKNVIIFSILSIILFKYIWIGQTIVWTNLVQAILMFNKYKKKS